MRKSCLYFRYVFSDLNDDSAEDLYSSSRGLTARRNKAWQWIGLHTLRIIVICLKYIFSTLYLVFQILAFNEAPFSKFYTHFLSPANLKPQTLQLFPPNLLFTVPLIWISLRNFEGKFILSGLRNTTLRKYNSLFIGFILLIPDHDLWFHYSLPPVRDVQVLASMLSWAHDQAVSTSCVATFSCSCWRHLPVREKMSAVSWLCAVFCTCRSE